MDESSWADIAIVALLAISTFIGIYRGFIRELLTLLTWIFASYIGIYYGQEVGDLFSISESANVNYWIGVAALFFSIVFVGYFVKIIICRAFHIVGAKPYDRVAGAIFGALRGSVVVVLILVAGAGTLNDQTWYKESNMVSRFKVFADIVLENMPEDWRKELKTDVKELEDTLHADESVPKEATKTE